MTVFAWPIAVVVLGVVFMVLFRKPVSTLIGRVKEISTTGVRTVSENPQQVAAPNVAPAEELMRAFDSPALRERENNIVAELKKRNLNDTGDTVRVLVRHLAGAQLQLEFERANSAIWGTQISLLQELNGSANPLEDDKIRWHYELASKAYPTVYENYSFQNYMAFLASNNLVIAQGTGWSITQFGREFLVYLAMTGRTGFRPY